MPQSGTKSGTLEFYLYLAVVHNEMMSVERDEAEGEGRGEGEDEREGPDEVAEKGERGPGPGC